MNVFKRNQIVTSITIIIVNCLCFNTITTAQKTDTVAIVNSIFPRGQKSISNPNFNGGVWIKEYASTADSLDCIVALVTFEPGVRTNWHMHPGGQIIIVVEGTGYYQEKGKPRRIIHKGDVIKCAAGVTHWHGASPDSEFAHMVVAPDVRKGQVIWMQKVTDAEYNGSKSLKQ